MRGRIPDELVGKVVQAHNIIDIVGQYVALKKSGRNYFGLCPFHSEKSPSFSVSEHKQIFYCFGCQVGGDVIKFLMELEKHSFVETVQLLADQKGIHLPYRKIDTQGESEEIKKAFEVVAKFYHHVLVNTDVGQEARKYLYDRGVEKETLVHFHIGFAPDSNQQLFQFLQRRGFSLDLLKKIGLIGKNAENRYYDYFRNRIMFPIHNSQGGVIAFGGRSLGDRRPKYLNSPEHPLFHKGNDLFNLHRARTHIRREKYAVLLEGYMDVVMAWQAGVHTGVASLGTALTQKQAKVLKKITDSVVICFDADTAGQSATLKGLEVLSSEDISVKVGRMPSGLDPDDYIRQYGISSFKENILANALSVMQFKLESLKQSFQLHEDEDRARYVMKAIQEITRLPRRIEQEYYLQNIAEEFNLPMESIKEEQRKITKQNRISNKMDKYSSGWNNGYQNLSQRMGDKSKILTVTEKSERFLLACMLQNRQIAEWVQETIKDGFYTEIHAVIAAYLYAYYAKGYSEDAGRFIGTLTDSELISKVSEISMMEVPESVSQTALMDCVNNILTHPIQKEIQEKEKMVRYLSNADQPVKAAELTGEIAKLRKEILKRRSTVEGGKTNWLMNRT